MYYANKASELNTQPVVADMICQESIQVVEKTLN